jgi:lysophospholipase L1-like esterase
MSTAENDSEELSKAVVKLCERRGIPCLDLFHSSGLRPWDSNFKALCYKHDENKGHFDEDGHAFIAPRIKSLLESIIM